MTHPTDEELDALVQRLNQLDRRMSFQSRNITGARTCRLAADAITTIRAQLAEVRAALDNANKIMDDWTTLHRVIADIRDASGIGSRLMLSELAHEIGKRIAEANARADRAEAALAAQIEADAGICGKHSYSNNQYVSMRMIDAAREIRAQPHDRSALDRLMAETREKALREAADAVMQKTYRPYAPKDFRDGYDVAKADVATAILALIEADHAQP